MPGGRPGARGHSRLSPVRANAAGGDKHLFRIYHSAMPLSPGLAAARRMITVVCAVLALVAVGGALAYSLSGDVGNGCGSGWTAARKPLPSPLLTEADKERIQRERLQPYEFGVAKQRPIEECRRAGASRLIKAGLGAGLVLIPIGGLLAFLYWPRREEMVDLTDDGYGGPPPPLAERKSDWAGR